MVKEIIASHRQETIKPTVVQNNVPAFALFAMFFIVIPLSGSLITEKNEGAYNRLRTLPISYFTILSSKTVVYVIVCLLQLLMMMAVGIWFFPAVFGMPALQTGNHVGLILVSALASALAAVGFGMLIGTLSHTIGQAAMFGSLFVVILSILGGIFIPVYLMPAPLQAVSIISPIRWGLDSFLDIFVRKATFAAVLPNICRLIVFFVLVQFISLFSFVKRN
jgi:ABC-2 type transport system permease protein